jgi:hypothetical protein
MTPICLLIRLEVLPLPYFSCKVFIADSLGLDLRVLCAAP